MSNLTQATVKPSRGNGHDGKNMSAIESDNYSLPISSIAKVAPIVAPYVSDRESMIAAAAYHHAEQRGFEPSHEVEDWLAAEMELEQRLAGEDRAC